MGIRAYVEQFLDLFTVPRLQFELPDDTAHTFSESAPVSIDLMFRDMYRGIGRIDRLKALSVPGVKRGRDLICSISTLPLVLYNSDREIARHPLLQRIDPDVTNVVTLAQTLEDLLFEGISWWRVIERDFAGFPTKARHLDVTSVTINPPSRPDQPAPLPSGYDPRFGVVYIDGKPVSGREVIRFDSPNTGLLVSAGRTIKRALALDEVAGMYAEHPRPLDYFSPAEGVDPADDEEVQKVLNDWARWRRLRATGYVPAALKYNSVDTPDPAELQLVELQHQAALGIANAIGLDPEDLGLSTTTRTYQNAVDRRKDRINDLLASYMKAITETLSGDNVTRRGYEVAFDPDDYLRADPKTRAEIDEIYNRMGAKTVTEIRRGNNWAPLTPAQRAELRPAQPSTREPIRVAAEINRPAIEAARFDQDDSSAFAFESTSASFAVNREERTITGLVVPFGEVATSRGRRWRFAPGSIQFADLSRIKLLRDHDWSQALGRAVEWNETERGIVAKFKVARGPEGDKALALAEDGVLDGLSVNVDPIEDAIPDPENKGVWLVKRSTGREVSLTARPAFDNSRVTSVAATRETGDEMPDEPEQNAPAAPAAPEPNDMNAQFAAFQAWMADHGQSATEPETPAVVNPTRQPAVTSVNEALPYRFDRGGNFLPTEHVFSADLRDMKLANDLYGTETDAGRRVMGLIQAQFTVETADVDELNPTIQRPDMYVDQREYRTPLWNFVNKGAPPNGVQPFTFPKFNAASGLVGDHTAGVEPTSGNFTTTGQTVTPTALSGKASIQREVFDMGGNPAVSTLIWNQMRRGYREGLESATATFLNTLTAATDITFTPNGAADDVLAAQWDAALAELQFVRGYDFEAFALEKELYKKFVAAEDTTGRRLYAQISPSNANGTAARRFVTLDLGGVTGVPSWALPSTPGSPNNSWLFDPSTVHGWATAPQRLEFAGTSATGEYAPVAMVDIAVWGYKAFANSDIGGVRQVIYDTTV